MHKHKIAEVQDINVGTPCHLLSVCICLEYLSSFLQAVDTHHKVCCRLRRNRATGLNDTDYSLFYFTTWPFPTVIICAKFHVSGVFSKDSLKWNIKNAFLFTIHKMKWETYNFVYTIFRLLLNILSCRSRVVATATVISGGYKLNDDGTTFYTNMIFKQISGVGPLRLHLQISWQPSPNLDHA